MTRIGLGSLFLVVFVAFSSATDVDVSASADSLYWSADRLNTDAGRTFTGSSLYWGWNGSVTQELADGITFAGGLNNDPILHNRLYTDFQFRFDNLGVALQPLLGLANSAENWFNPGLGARVSYTWPGVVYTSAGFSTTFAPLSKPGDSYQRTLEAEVGSLLPNGIISIHGSNKSSTTEVSSDLTTVDTAVRYWLNVEMFLKNVPFRWSVMTGYQNTGREYLEDAADTLTTLHSLLIGGSLSWDVAPAMTIYADAVTSYFQYGWDSAQVDIPSTTSVLQVRSGIRYHW